jgi:hypothetical protein
VDAGTPKFKVGQSVKYSASVRRFGSNASFKIVRLLPSDGGGGRQYRIKSASEAHERVAQEDELNQEF